MIKRFLVAKTPQDLEIAQLRNNALFGKYFHYDIIFDGSKWYAWFLTDGSNLIKRPTLPGEVSRG